MDNDLCPLSLLKGWCREWGRKWAPFYSDGPLFSILRPDSPRAVTYNAARATLKSHFPSRAFGTHSLRKGGAAWLRFTAKLSKELVQHQGGWVCLETMELCYVNLSENEKKQQLLKGMEAALRTPTSTA